MRYKALFTLLFTLLSGNALSDWKKINDLDYTWALKFTTYLFSLKQANINPIFAHLW